MDAIGAISHPWLVAASGADLRSGDLRNALAFAGDLAACQTAAELDRQVRRLPRLIGADSVIVGETRKPASGSGEATLDASDEPVGFFDAEARAAFGRLWQQHPVVVRHFRGVTRRPLKVSDFVSDLRWRRGELYNDCYRRRLTLSWEISTRIRVDSEVLACAALQRANQDFDERDRALLDAVTPHLRAGYARLESAARRERSLALLERGLEQRGEAAIVVDHGGAIVGAGPLARSILRDWFGGPVGFASLPPEVEAWRRSERGSPAPAVLDRARAGRRLRMHLVAGPEEDAIILGERGGGMPDAEALRRRLPISKREAEVLALLAEGMMNAAIGHELGISRHTVSRHIERIYTKLGVHNRAGVIAATRDALGG
jgi:DNA-binding CsgD family transcriptional regulator